MTTSARLTSETSCHWYAKDGTPVYEVPRATGQGSRPTTLADARKLGLLPSVTTILSILRKPQLETWINEQLCLAVLTTPRPNDEQLDAFVHRVIHEERHQDQERDVAAKRGIDIHDAIEGYFTLGRVIDPEMWDWIAPTIEYLDRSGQIRHTEHVVTHIDGYGGRVDAIQETTDNLIVWDFKSSKNIPKKSYVEHILQLSAYANAVNDKWRGPKPIITGNIYISTTEVGKFAVCKHEEPWHIAYCDGFKPLLDHWQWANNYHP